MPLMRINLSEIPEEGQEFILNSQTGELNQILRDLIGPSKYESRLFIRPLNTKDFQMTGTIKTEIPEICSRCGIDIQFAVDERFHEILIPKLETPRTGKQAKANHLSENLDEGPSVTEYEGLAFDIGEYLHEVVGIAIPYNPAPPEDKDGNCSTCLVAVRGKTFGYSEEIPLAPEDKPKNPFEVLKGLKLN